MAKINKNFSSTDAVTLREYFEEKFKASEIALSLATSALNARLEGMNEIREAMKDQSSRYLSRSESELITSNIEARVRTLEQANAELRGKASANSVYAAYILAIIGILISLVLGFYK